MRTSSTAQRLRQLMLYIIRQHQLRHEHPLTIHHMLLLVATADFSAYRQLGASISHATYRRQPEGRVPDGFYRILARLLKHRVIRINIPWHRTNHAVRQLTAHLTLTRSI